MYVMSLSYVWLFVTPMDCSSPGSSAHWILQATILEWVAKFSRVPSLTQGLNPGLLSPALAGRFFITSTTWETHLTNIHIFKFKFPIILHTLPSNWPSKTIKEIQVYDIIRKAHVPSWPSDKNFYW